MRKRTMLGTAVTAMLLMAVAHTAHAQAAPAGSTGQCKDGTFTSATQKWQACRGHKGVQSWFAAGSATAATATPPKATTAPPTPPPTSAVAPTATALGVPGSSKKVAAAKRPVAPGGGPGLVWVNTESKIYHCPGTEDYGTTKTGKYMSEADAKQAGARANRNVPCTK